MRVTRNYDSAIAMALRQKHVRVALLERLFLRIKKRKNGCWEWIGALNSNGYAVIRLGGWNGRTVFVHQIMWLLGNNRTIPRNLEPHHKCVNTKCIRPSHLKMVTHRVNMMLSNSPGGINSRKTKCFRGHPYTADNTIIIKRIRGGKFTGYERRCRACRKFIMDRLRNPRKSCR